MLLQNKTYSNYILGRDQILLDKQTIKYRWRIIHYL